MKVSVSYWAQVKKAAGVSSEDFDLDGACSAQELVARLAAAHGEPLRGFLLDAEGKLRGNLLLILGDEQVLLDTPVQLKDGDRRHDRQPIAGG